ncbi:MAG: hypothetical protein HPY83_15695 [Anaerolineae bacterium]|nr:hypothetical protein [Anaerolineae bacterium]
MLTRVMNAGVFGTLLLVLVACGGPGLFPQEATGTVVLVPADLPPPTATVAVSPTASPTATVTSTVTPTVTHTPSPTASPTATAAPTATPTPLATADPLWVLEDATSAREEVSTTVAGLPVSVSLITGASLGEREWFAVERVTLNTTAYADGATRLGEAAMRAHWHAWLAQHPDRSESFEQFLAALGQGQDRSYTLLATLMASGGAAPEAVSVDPARPLELFYTDEPGPIYLAEGTSFHLALTPEGNLRIGIQVAPPVRRYYDRHLAEDPVGAKAYYTSYVFSPASAFHVLGLSREFQRSGVRDPQGATEATRLTLCGEFRDLDELLLRCEEGAGYEGVVRAVVRSD